MTTVQEATDAAHAPLAGVPLTVTGDSTAAQLAGRHLRLLGCVLTGADSDSGSGSSPSSAGRLVLGADAAGSPPVGCAIDWAGPVRLPLTGEADVQAACGIAQVHGRRYGAPTALGIDYAGAVAGVLTVQGLLAARLAAVRGAPVGSVRTSVAGAALLAVSQYLAAATAEEAERQAPGTATAGEAEQSAPGEVKHPEPGTVQPGPCAPPLTSRDGVRFEVEALEAGQWLAFWARLGADRRTIGAGWPAFQRRFSSASCLLPGELGSTAGEFDYQQLLGAAADAGLAVVPVRPAAQGGYPVPPWRIARAGGRGPALAPAAGPDRPPLDGVVVVEMTRRLQGPLAGHLLALLGARVVRIEPPGGDPLRGVEPMAGDCSARFHALNRGKEVVEADPRSPAGRRALRELVGGADVFLHNLAPGKAADFGLDAGQLLPTQPALVHAWASGWGELFGAAPPFGTDYVVQAHSGLAALVTPPGRPASPSLMTITDVFGGLISAEAVLAALLARATSGHGRRVDSSLWSAAVELLRTATPDGAAGSTVPAAHPGELARDPRFATALYHDRCALPRSPWEFDR